MSGQEHWDQVYATKAVSSVSWFQPEATMSLSLIRSVRPDRDSAIVDVGAGASPLVDGLLDAGYSHVTVLDLAAAALAVSRDRLGDRAHGVTWVTANVLTHRFPAGAYDVWHDRAVFHFLTEAVDRATYASQVRAALRLGGHVIIGTFAEDGPTRCSGLDVCRYSAEGIQAALGPGFRLVQGARENHPTPGGSVQAFQYAVLVLEHVTPADAR